MNGAGYAVGVCFLGLWLGGACSKTAGDESAGQSGSAGTGSAGGGAGGSAGANLAGAADAGMSGKAGSGQQGGAAGASAGGDQGGRSDAGAGGEAEAGSAGASPGGPIQAVVGQLCPVAATIGVVRLGGFPTPYVQATLYDRKDPWIGEPELETPTCELHRYVAGICAACKADEVCSPASTCVPAPRSVKDATLRLSTGGSERQYEADTTIGGIYSMVDIGDATSAYAMTLSWGEVVVQLDAMPVAGASLTNAAVSIEGDYAAPGALDATWKPTQSGAFVSSRIPINHHAGGPTFTECAAAESAGAFHADAAMINPLAVRTGLEFQGLQHEFVAAASTPAGCVEFRFGEQILILPD